MPRLANESRSPSPSPFVKREASYHPTSDSESDVKPKTKKAKKASGTKAAPRSWTSDEYESLLKIALSQGASRANFEGKLPNRTGLQCIKTWENTLRPYLLEAAREKANGKR